ncbi:MAG: hypothetical protein LBB89_09055 [Treponema sp.]|nr:hypothetical protein [Treponema sp.]
MKKRQFIAFILAVFTVTITLVFGGCDTGTNTSGGGGSTSTGGTNGRDTNTPGGGSQPAGGGTAANPYRISSKADFMAISGGVGTNGKYYRLEADLVGTESISEPLGNASNKRFIGHFDGNGHTVNLNITGNHQSAGLFAAIGGGIGTIPAGAGWFNNAGTVKNLILTGTVNVSGSNVEYAGAVAGDIADIGSSIRGIASSVIITVSGPSAASAGGIAGAAGSGQDVSVEIENCYSTGNVSITNTSGGSVNAGGITGYCAAATIRYCRASGVITASASSGGIPGYSGSIFGSSSLKTTGSYCVALSPSVSGDNPVNLSGVMMGGTFRVGSSFGTLDNNYANSAMTVNGSASSDNVLSGGNGGAATLAAAEAADWWRNTAGWSGKFGTSEAAPWKWDSNSKRPVLWFE